MHLTDEILEWYELGRLEEPAVEAVEEHLLICEACRKLDDNVRVFLSAMRAGLRRLDSNVIVWELHLTGKGLMELWVERAGDRWVSRRFARFADSSVYYSDKIEAIREC